MFDDTVVPFGVLPAQQRSDVDLKFDSLERVASAFAVTLGEPGQSIATRAASSWSRGRSGNTVEEGREVMRQQGPFGGVGLRHRVHFSAGQPDSPADKPDRTRDCVDAIPAFTPVSGNGISSLYCC